MTATTTGLVAVEPAVRPAGAVRAGPSLSPNQRAWARFKRNRLGYVSLLLFIAMLVVGTFAELFSNEQFRAHMDTGATPEAVAASFAAGVAQLQGS